MNATRTHVCIVRISPIAEVETAFDGFRSTMQAYCIAVLGVALYMVVCFRYRSVYNAASVVIKCLSFILFIRTCVTRLSLHLVWWRTVRLISEPFVIPRKIEGHRHGRIVRVVQKTLSGLTVRILHLVVR